MFLKTPGGMILENDKYGGAQATFYRWRQKSGALTKSEFARLKDLEQENVRLKKLVAQLTLDKQILQEVLSRPTEVWAPP